METRFKIALWFTVGSTVAVAGGCRVGNYSSHNDTASGDPVTGYYDAAPQRLQFCASTSGASGDTRCADASTTEIPAFLSESLTHPLTLLLRDAASGEAILTAAPVVSNTPPQLPVWVRSDNTTLDFVGSTPAQILWLDSQCTTRIYLDMEGSIVRGAGRPVPGTTSGRTVGSLKLTAQVIRSFDSSDGSCATELQAMSACYQNVNHCGGTSGADNQAGQARVQSIFEQYIQAGVMTGSDIADVTALGYEVHYQ
jgi:hypothetical protein